MDEKLKRMKELIEILSSASRAYYQESRELMSNLDYDRLYDELLTLEQETGTIFSGSPTQQVGYEVLSELPKERHERPMLSLNKTKSVEELQSFAGEQKALLSWKLDGLTVVLTYEGGRLAKAVTRGNGEIGEVVTSNARAFVNLPSVIPFAGRLILRGEAVITYPDFERINAAIPDVDARYKNPRNLCSSSVRRLDSRITARQSVRFFAFFLVEAEGIDFKNSRKEQFEWLRTLGFEVVEYREVTASALPDTVADFAARIPEMETPSDGLVLLLDDIAYGQSLGRTSKFPRDSIAFKWADEQRETVLSYIEWSASRTGLINPVAVFEPVELEGTTVSRASVHNVSILEELKLGTGDRIRVYKANMIIPQIAENLTKSGPDALPGICPVCGGATQVRGAGDAKSLYCTNSGCPAKKIKRYALLVSRDALNIDGLSEMTLEKFIAAGFIHEPDDIFHLDRHREAIIAMDGFGEKSYENLTAAAQAASHTSMERLIFGLGIPGIGPANAKVLCRQYENDISLLRNAKKEDLCVAEGIGEALAESWVQYFAEEENNRELDHLLADLTFAEAEKPGKQSLAGKIFVITGSLNHFKNRKELQKELEALGGKVTGSVSAKTSFLINNDITSNSSKNKAARELGIPILAEEEVLELLGGREEENNEKKRT